MTEQWEKIAELRAEVQRELRLSEALRGDLQRMSERLAHSKARAKALQQRYDTLCEDHND